MTPVPQSSRRWVTIAAVVILIVLGAVVMDALFSNALLICGLFIIIASVAVILRQRYPDSAIGPQRLVNFFGSFYRWFTYLLDWIAYSIDTTRGVPAERPLTPGEHAREKRTSRSVPRAPSSRRATVENFNPNVGKTSATVRRKPDEPTVRLADGETAFDLALAAARRAGLDASTGVLPVDLGFMTFTGDERTLVRSDGPADNAEFVQPFVVLRLTQPATGRIRFELIDPDGQRLFVHEDVQNLTSGANLVSPAARMRVRSSFNFSSAWTLRVSADDVILAEHEWTWRLSRESHLRQHVAQDGEIHASARLELIDEDPFNRVSLDDLLNDSAAARRER